MLLLQVEAVGFDVFTAVEQLRSTPIENVCAGRDGAFGKPEKFKKFCRNLKFYDKKRKSGFFPIKSGAKEVDFDVIDFQYFLGFLENSLEVRLPLDRV